MISILEKINLCHLTSQITGATDMKLDGSVLEEKSFFKMLKLSFTLSPQPLAHHRKVVSLSVRCSFELIKLVPRRHTLERPTYSNKFSPFIDVIRFSILINSFLAFFLNGFKSRVNRHLLSFLNSFLNLCFSFSELISIKTK